MSTPTHARSSDEPTRTPPAHDLARRHHAHRPLRPDRLHHLDDLPMNTPTPADQLRTAIDDLTRPVRRRIMLETDPPTTTPVNIPSLLDQLRGAVEHGNSSDGTHTIPTSKLPLSDDVLDLLRDIDTAVVYRRTRAGLPVFHGQHDPKARRLTWEQLLAAVDQRRLGHALDLTDALRGLAEHYITHQAADVAELAALVTRWVGRARNTLSTDPKARGIRGAACPQCGTVWIVDEQGVRQPALIIVLSTTGWVRAAQCRATPDNSDLDGRCGATWWRGEALDALGSAIEAAERAAQAERAADLARQAAAEHREAS